MKGLWAGIVIAASFASAHAAAAPKLEAVLEGLSAEKIVTGLQFPVALAAAADGILLITEKAGALRIVRDGVLLQDPAATFAPITRNEAGLIAIALDPDFESSHRFYVTYTPEAFQNALHVVRLELAGDSAVVLDDPWLALPSRAETDRHYGANLDFSPRGQLYISLGELRNEADAQDPTTLPGSLLRYEADLTIPEDNPFPGSPVFAYGLRNPFGLEVGDDGRVFEGENGADIADEINLIEPGRNYGWPRVEGFCDHFPKREPCATSGLYVDPIVEFRQVVSPTGLVVYDAPLMPELRGELLVGGFHSNAVQRFRLSPGNGPAELVGTLLQFEQAPGSYAAGIVDVEKAPDGALLVLVGGFSAGELWRIAPAMATRSAPLTQPMSQKANARAVGGCTIAIGPPPEPTLLPYAVLVALLLAKKRLFA